MVHNEIWGRVQRLYEKSKTLYLGIRIEMDLEEWKAKGGLIDGN